MSDRPIAVAAAPVRAEQVTTDRTERLRQRVRRPALRVESEPVAPVFAGVAGKNVLIIDLNNLSTFPTLAIGILVATMRNAGHQVRVMCPLSHDVPAAEREYCETWVDDLRRRMHLSTSPAMRALSEAAFRAYRWRSERPHPKVIAETWRAIQSKPDVILLSAYLQHYNSVREIAKMARGAGIPVLLGGPMFNVPGTAEVWRQIDGVSAVVGAESDLTVAAMVSAVCEGGDLTRFAGVVLPDGTKSPAAPPFRRLDDSPIPDFTDFPWDRYPVRVIPVMTGRGCQWDKCLFCSDVISTNGRTFRTKSVETVLIEMQELARRHETTNFMFLDLKLNSYPDMIRGIATRIQDYVQGAEWIGTVHVDLRADNGLSRADLEAAVKGGMRRVSFGLESGSQRLLDRMEKGTSVERNSEFIRNAYDAGLSIRSSMFRGFPGETAADMAATADFLEEHAPYMDRIRFVDFSLCEGTPIHDAVVARSDVAGRVQADYADSRRARIRFSTPEGRDRAYRREKARALSIVHQINRRHLRETARQFDGLM